MESKDSDYDIRFVYKRPYKDYLRIHSFRDVIECQWGADRDYNGFDLYKFVRLILNSNPSVIEWLLSDIVYLSDGSSKEILRAFVTDYFNPAALYYHYKSMCKTNYLSYLHSDKEVTYKKYLYAMRGLVNAKYVEQTNQIPPITFTNAIREVGIPSEVKDKLKEIIKIKKEGGEKEHISHIGTFESYIEDFLAEDTHVAPVKMHNIDALQQFVYGVLGV
jgi:hypothetical protein